LKKILITGHSGFLGTNLINYLADKYDILGLSDNLKKFDNIKQIKGDVKKISFNKIPKNISCIIHLAALTDVRFCENNPTACFESNVSGTQNMLEIARKLNSKFIFLSTSHVYGKPKKLPILESHPRNPISFYATSKVLGEILCESYSKTYGMDISIITLSNKKSLKQNCT